MRFASVLVVLLLAASPAGAQALVVADQIGHSRALDATSLAGLPPTEITVSFATAKGPEQGRFAGPLLWSALDHLGLMPPGDGKARLIHGVVVTGRDGYAVLVSFGEIDPGFEGKQVVLATAVDGKPNDKGEVRLVVPGDRHGARNVRDVVRLDVR